MEIKLGQFVGLYVFYSMKIGIHNERCYCINAAETITLMMKFEYTVRLITINLPMGLGRYYI
jgi:hypothetical protein